MSQIAASLCAVVLLLGTAALIIRREPSRSGYMLGSALLVTAILEVCDLSALTFSENALQWKHNALYAEALLPLTWVLSSLTYARQPGPWKLTWLHKICICLMAAIAATPFVFTLHDFFYAPDFPNERVLFLASTGFMFYLFVMACLVWAMVNFETTLTNASPDGIWRIKFFVIGVGVILAVQVFYFSQGLLYRTINMNYTPLRSFMLIVAAAMMIYSQTARHGNVRVQVSRQVAFRSFILIAIAAYLIMLGLLGEGMKYLGTSFLRSVILGFIFLTGIVLVLLLLSERVRREVKVVLHKNFYQNKHDYRTQWLGFTQMLATATTADELQHRVLKAYCSIFGIHNAALYLHEHGPGGYSLVSQYEMQAIRKRFLPENPLLISMRERDWVINTQDDNPDIMAANRDFIQAHHISFIVPLYDSSNSLEGFITLGRPINHDEVYIYEDYDLMKTIARQAALAILNQRLSEQIVQSREIEAIGNVATFVVHDLKNLVSNLSLIVQNSVRHIHKPEFQRDMFTSLGHTVTKMQTLISRLKNLGESDLLNRYPVDLLSLAHKTAVLLPEGRVEIHGTSAHAHAVEDEIQKVILNLILNALEASADHDTVQVEVGSTTAPFIAVTDNGCGMPGSFISSGLFKPFSTTKKGGLGIGLYQCRKIVEAHGGRIDVDSQEGSGSTFTVWLPEIMDINAAPEPAMHDRTEGEP